MKKRIMKKQRWQAVAYGAFVGLAVFGMGYVGAYLEMFGAGCVGVAGFAYGMANI